MSLALSTLRVHWQRYVVAFQADRANFLLPLHEQHWPAMLVADIFVQAAVQLPVDEEPTSFKP